MVQFDNQFKQVKLKVVYYGPALGGKTTCLQHIHKATDPQRRTKLYALNTATDRTLFFDLLGIDLGRVRGYSLTLQLYTVPGQVQYNATRRAVLAGADGVLFVADSQASQMAANEESLANLDENLRTNGLDIDSIPLVFAFNKRDMSDVVGCDGLNASLNRRQAPWFETVATTGRGVMEAFAAVIEATVRSVGDRLGLTAQPDALARLVEGVRGALRPYVGALQGEDGVVVLRPQAKSATLSGDELVSEAVRANLALTDLNARLDHLGHELSRRVRQLGAVHEFGKLMSGVSDAAEVTAGLMEALLSELGVGYGTLLLERDGVLAEVERRGLSADPLGRREADGSSAAGVVLATREPMLVHVDETGPVTSRVAEELLGLGLVAGLAVPLVVQGRAVGVVVAYADASRGAFGEDDRDMALGLAANAAVALAHLRSLGALEEANRTLESTVRSRTHELELALAQRTVLTDQLEERRRALEAANNDLRGLDELKGELLTHIARSFDEPVASIQTAARILARDESPPEKAAKLVDIISGEATRLSELIMSARQAAVLSGDDTGAGAGAVAVPLADLLKRVLAPLRSAIGERRIAVHVKVAQGLEHVLGREEQLEAALRAIVKNAVEYNAPGGAVTVTARPVLREGGSFTEFQVVDTGIGIPADDIPHARELFWKGTTASGERTRGLGLGLAVAGRVAEAHKGMLEISSEPGRGTTVSLLIPAPASPQA